MIGLNHVTSDVTGDNMREISETPNHSCRVPLIVYHPLVPMLQQKMPHSKALKKIIRIIIHDFLFNSRKICEVLYCIESIIGLYVNVLMKCKILLKNCVYPRYMI